MKYLFINSVYGVLSTGKLIKEKCHELIQQGNVCAVAYGRDTISDSKVIQYKIGTKADYISHGLWARLFDCQGFKSARATKKLLKKIENYNPDIIWLHNLHGYYIHIGLLFEWLKSHPQIKVYWTLHDCWALTGHCAHFTAVKCNRWKNQCFGCSQKKSYPASYLLDRSAQNFFLKKQLFQGIQDMTIITPSQWLADLVKESILATYRVQVQNNTINKNVYKPTASDFRKKYHLENKWIILGVASTWEKEKGLSDILKLREKLDDRFQFVLVGIPSRVLRTLPNGIIAFTRTESQKELVELYSTADVFVNPTHQDTYPTVNLEARACGTPVVTYNVGGSPESAGWEHVVEENDIEGLLCEINNIVYKNSCEV